MHKIALITNNQKSSSALKVLLWGLVAFFVAACNPANESNTASMPVSATPADANDKPLEPIRYNEFIWCSNGDNATTESLAARQAHWLDAVAKLDASNFASASLSPSGWESDDFDRLTLLMWPNKEVRNAGWASYEASGIEEDLAATFPGVESCGGTNWSNIYGFDVYQPRVPSQPGLAPDAVGYAGYQFCSFNEGMKPADLRAVVRGDYMDFLSAFESEVGPTTYNFTVQIPDFDSAAVERHNEVPPQFDLLWSNFWGDKTQKPIGDSAWQKSGAEIQNAFDQVMTCSDEQGYDIVLVRPRPA